MKFKSLRVQLPLSYAGIALLATLVLGLVLLATLRSYYQNQERRYLGENAQAMSYAVSQMMQTDLPANVFEEQIKNLSFLTLARIRVLDENGNLLVDSGVPDTIQIASLSGGTGPAQFFVSTTGPHTVPFTDRSIPVPDGGIPGGTGVIFVNMDAHDEVPDDTFAPLPFERMVCPVPDTAIEGQPISGSSGFNVKADVIGFVAPVGQSIYGYDLSSPGIAVGRSERAVTIPLADPTGTVIGNLKLSDGPAYGMEIVSSVARAWVIAGLLAVMLAAGVGWVVSQRMAAPVLALTATTSRMAEGDLSARASVTAPEELSSLGQSFNEMADRIEEMISTLRNFVSDAAHELHTPLTALRSDLELAAETQQYTASLSSRALAQADRLQALVNNLLSLSRIEAREYLQTTINLNRLLQEMGELYASRAEQAGLAFSLHVPSHPATVLGNDLQLRSAIGNLLDNAIKFTGENGEIRLALEEQSEGWKIRVQDDGIGVPEDEIPHLFRRFHRARNVSGYPGNGLGLAIVKAIADAHGGYVAVENRMPGLDVSLWLPKQVD